MTVTLLDYGAGNVTSVRRALEAGGAHVRVARTDRELAGASAIVVPGVGHFAATAVIDAAARQALTAAIDRGVALLGICLGMQWLYEGSDEAPDCPGLGVFTGRCRPIESGVKTPHVGWNTLEWRRDSALLAGVGSSAWAYFSHSFAAPVSAEAVAVTSYGGPFAAMVERGRVFGTQWHPEKSAGLGRRVLQTFLDLAARRS